ncbi:MAG: aminomethyl transferase family protein, partial [Nitratireductor sp.]|nr:aminomethyl transferase family protein [Nitratireductor sp.]
WGFDVAVTDASRAVAALSLQGPTSFATLRQAGLGELADLAPFGIRDIAMGEITITVSRTGFTGDLGYELWTAPEHAPQLWDGLMEAGRLHGIRPIGYAAVEMA